MGPEEDPVPADDPGEGGLPVHAAGERASAEGTVGERGLRVADGLGELGDVDGLRPVGVR